MSDTTLFIPRGLPAAGKSVWSKEQVALSKGRTKRVSRDQLREMVDPAWTAVKEKAIVIARDAMIKEWLAAGYSVIADDTNLSTKVYTDLQAIGQDLGAKVVPVDFTDVHVEDCLKRDAGRPHSVGQDVIMKMYYKYLCEKPPIFDPKLPSIVICDVDGTIAEKKEGRGERGWFDEERVFEDGVRENVLNNVMAAAISWKPERKVLYLSGRSEKARVGTQLWLDVKALVNVGTTEGLLMRKEGDSRPDYIIKKEIYEAHIKGKYNIAQIFDDRPAVLRMWEGLGFGDRLFRVGRTMEEF